VNDTVETALSKGKKFGRSFFPILDGDHLTGTVSYLDIFDSLYQILGIEEEITGVSLECGQEGGGRMAAEVVRAVDSAA
jgi:acetoin utilization protein AcuB